MATHDYNIANQGFPAFRSDLNNSLSAIVSNNSNATEPSTTYAYQWWYDTSTDTLKFRNADNDAWVSFATFDMANDTVNLVDSAIDVVTDTTPQLGGDLDLNSNDITGTGDINVTGTVTATAFSGDGSALTGVGGGITETDMWRVNTSFTNASNGVAEVITSNWERADVNFEKIGTGLTESSGLFSFPSTGKYLIIALASYNPTSDTSDVQFYSQITTNNGSSYSTLALAQSGASANVPENVGFNYICDITETTNTKIRFGTVGGTYITWQGNTNSQRLGFTCIRLGDT